MMKQLVSLFLFSFLVIEVTSAQYFTGIGTKWSDEFTEWNLYFEQEELIGELRMRWQFQNDWSTWDYRIGEEIGTISLVWKNNPGQWEVRGNNQVITARTVYNRDFTEWRITDNKTTLTLRSRWTNNFNEWAIKESDRFGRFELFTEWEDDPREWIVVDELDESIGMPMKMCVLFLAVYNSIPKG